MPWNSVQLYSLISAVKMIEEQKEKKQKHFWCVWTRFILVMASCSAVHNKTKPLLSSQWDLCLHAVTLPVLNHGVLPPLPKTTVCLQVFKKTQLLLFSHVYSYSEYGKTKNTVRVLWTLVFIQVKLTVICLERVCVCCSHIMENQKHLSNTS